MPSRLGPILLAQWRGFWNYRPAGGRGGRIAASLLWLFWYGMWAFLGFAAELYAAGSPRPALAIGLPWMLTGISFFWQFAPILTANLGASIGIKKLRIYPIPDGELFLVELLLRLIAAAELLLLLAGLTIGLLRNPSVPHWAPVPALLLFAAFNLLLAAGLRSLLERLLGIRRIREVVVLLTVLCAALPQLLTYTGLPAGVRRLFVERQHVPLPWTAAGRLAVGDLAWVSAAALLAWTAAAYAFARRMFRRSLETDEAAARAAGAPARERTRWTESLYRLPALFFRDPLAALMEKELRSLARSPRFRIVFLMGFSFGMVIWWPLFGTGGPPGPGHVSYPVIVSAYALILLAEVAFWNQFGFDRAAAQIYFSAPIPFSTALRAKNFTALGFIVFEVSVVIIVCVLLRVPLTAGRIFESYAVTLTFALYFLAAGNLSSVYHPRPVDPEHSWGRASAGRFQVYLVLLFPLFLAPLALAYLAAYAFNSRAAFYTVLAFDAFAGAAAYQVATSSAVAAAAARKEQFLAALGQSSGPIVAE
jgi:ABC-2 type transport system permease protein